MIFNGNSTAINLNTQEVTMHHVFVIPLSASHICLLGGNVHGAYQPVSKK